MAVDKGSLRYSIIVVDQFSVQTERFRAELKASQAAFRQFKQDLRGLQGTTSNIAGTIRRLTKQTRESTVATSRAATASRRRARAARTEEKQLNRLAGAKRRVASADAQQATATARANQRAARSIAAIGAASNRAATRTKRLTGATKKQENAVNRVSFTFRRLFGILAAFAAARFAIAGFFGLIRATIDFQKNLEQAELGIAALITAVGDVRSATGQAVSASDKLALAQKEARRQTQLLRRDAQQTAATFDQLVSTFQVAIAPGLVAGLSIDEIRKFTVRIAQAAAAIGVQQNQLAEEIRSLLAGTIQARTTRIATALGITNEDIRLAKEAGTLVQFLEDRFKAFEKAGVRALDTIEAKITNTRDALLQLLGAAGGGFVGAFKDLLDTVRAALQGEDEEGILTPNPRAVELVRRISDGLRGALQEAIRLTEVLRFEDLEATTEFIGNAFLVVARALGFAIEIFVRGLNKASLLVRGLLGIFQRGFNFLQALFPETDLKAITVAILEWSAALLVIKFTLVLLAPLVGLIVAPFKLLSGLATGLVVAVKALKPVLIATLPFLNRLATPFILATAALGFLVASTKDWGREVHGVNLSLLDTVNIWRHILALAIGTVIAKTKSFAEVVKIDAQRAFTNLQGAVDDISTGFDKGIAHATDFLGLTKEQAKVEESLRRGRDKQRRAERRRLALERQKSRLRGELDQFAIEKRAREGINRTITGAKEREEELQQAITATKKTFEELFRSFSGRQFEDPVQEQRNLLDIINQLPAVIQRSTQSIADQGKVLKELTDDIRKAGDEFNFAFANVGVSGAIRRQAKILAEAGVKERETNLQLSRELENAQKRLNSLAARRLLTEQKINKLAPEERQVAQNLVQDAEALLNAQTRLAEVEARRESLILTIRNAQKVSNREAEAAAQNRLQSLNKERQDLLQTVSFLEDAFRNITQDDDTRVLFELVTDLVSLKGQEKATDEQILEIQERIAEVSERINQAARERVAAVAAEAAFRSKVEADTLRARTEAAARIRQAERSGDSARIQRAQAEGRLQILQQQRAVLLDNQRIQRERHRANILESGFSLKTLELLKQGSQQLKLQRAERAALNEQIARTEDQLEEIKLIQEGTTLQGLQRGLRDFANQFQSTFVAMRDTMISALQEVSNFIANLVVDAFDPNNKLTLRERFIRFFQGIAKLFLRALIQVGIAKLLSGFFTAAPLQAAGQAVQAGGLLVAVGASFLSKAAAALQTAATTLLIANIIGAGGSLGAGVSSGSGGGSGGGSAKGGVVPRGRSWQPSLAHLLRPEGRAIGGLGRPRGLDPRDTVPMWLQPHEFVMRVAAVRKYGVRFMSALNQGLVDPVQLPAFQGTMKAARKGRVTRGFATGGQVSTAAVAAEPPESASVLLVPTQVADEQTMDRFLAEGSPSFLRYIKDHAADVRSALGIERGKIR